MKSKIEKAVLYIKGFCEKHYGCEKCKLYDKENSVCMLRSDVPCCWDFLDKNDD